MRHIRIHQAIYQWSNYVRTINTIDTTDVSFQHLWQEPRFMAITLLTTFGKSGIATKVKFLRLGDGVQDWVSSASSGFWTGMIN